MPTTFWICNRNLLMILRTDVRFYIFGKISLSRPLKIINCVPLFIMWIKFRVEVTTSFALSNSFCQLNTTIIVYIPTFSFSLSLKNLWGIKLTQYKVVQCFSSFFVLSQNTVWRLLIFMTAKCGLGRLGVNVLSCCCSTYTA